MDSEIFRSEEGNIPERRQNRMLMEGRMISWRGSVREYINEAKETTRMREIIRLNKELLEMKERSYGGQG